MDTNRHKQEYGMNYQMIAGYASMEEQEILGFMSGEKYVILSGYKNVILKMGECIKEQWRCVKLCRKLLMKK